MVSFRISTSRGKGKVVTRHSNADMLDAWRERVGYLCQQTMRAEGIRAPVRGQVLIQLMFYLPAPKGMIDACRKQSVSVESIPHLTFPDTDKLIRAVGDGLTGVLYLDDSQVVRWEAEKAYGLQPRCEIGAEVELEAFHLPGFSRRRSS